MGWFYPHCQAVQSSLLHEHGQETRHLGIRDKGLHYRLPASGRSRLLVPSPLSSAMTRFPPTIRPSQRVSKEPRAVLAWHHHPLARGYPARQVRRVEADWGWQSWSLAFKAHHFLARSSFQGDTVCRASLVNRAHSRQPALFHWVALFLFSKTAAQTAR